MNLEEFVTFYNSPTTEESNRAKAEFGRQQSASKKLASWLHSLVVRELDKQSNLISRSDHFYSSDLQGERFFAFLTPVSLKKPERLAAKLQEIRNSKPNLANDDWWWHAKDLARFRIVTANLSDLILQRDLIANIICNSQDPERLFLRDAVRDYIWTEPNERHNASKSIHFRICDSRRTIIEIQIMTLLQYSWDQIQHWLYEIQRASSNPLSGLSKNIERSYWALSNSLFVLDEYIVSLDNRDPRSVCADIPQDLTPHLILNSKQ